MLPPSFRPTGCGLGCTAVLYMPGQHRGPCMEQGPGAGTTRQQVQLLAAAGSSACLPRPAARPPPRPPPPCCPRVPHGSLLRWSLVKTIIA